MILKQGNCLELMKEIEDKSVDMICCDLPFGTTACKWDTVIPFDKLWEQYDRIIKDDGAIVLFGSEPFSSSLRMSNLKEYKYDWIWKKNKVGNIFNCKHSPLKIYETISVFSKGDIANGAKNLMIYNPQGLIACDNKRSNKRKSLETTVGRRPSREGEYVQKVTNYPRNILEFSNETGLHPTQKPVDLLEYLINTYTCENEVVLDSCIGSGSTGVACVNINRSFIGFELDENYFKIAENRIQEAICQKEGVLMIKLENSDTSLNESA